MVKTWRIGNGQVMVVTLFKDKLKLLVGQRARCGTLFWKDLRVGDRALEFVFPRLFRTARDKAAKVIAYLPADRDLGPFPLQSTKKDRTSWELNSLSSSVNYS